MMHRAWSSIVEVPYCFSRSYVKFQGHTALKSVKFDPNWAFPDCNSSFNSPMAMKCCTKLETAKERCPIVFQGHPSNFKVTWDKTSPILTQIGRFRTIGRSQLSNPSDLPCFPKFTITFILCEIYRKEFPCRCIVLINNWKPFFLFQYSVYLNENFHHYISSMILLETKKTHKNYASWGPFYLQRLIVLMGMAKKLYP